MMDTNFMFCGLITSVSLLVLARLGYDLLWGVPLRDDSLKAIVDVKRSKRFPNGNALTTNITGYHGIDEWMITPVILYEGLLDGSSLPYFLMLFDVHASMQAMSTVMLVRLKVFHRLSPTVTSLMLAVLGMFNQAYGAAFVYPLYCLAEVLLDLLGARRPMTQPNLTTRQAQAIWTTSLFEFVLPLVFVAPWLLGLSRPTRQTIVAYYRFAPLAFAATSLIAEIAMPSESDIGTVYASRTIATVLDLATAYAAIGHIAALILPLLKKSPLATLSRVFLPTSSHIRPGSKAMISDAAHRFLQYDIYVIAVAFIVWDFWMERGWMASDVGLKVADKTFSSVLLGPGAVVAQTVKRAL